MNRVLLVADKTIFTQHDTGPAHPESPLRVIAIEHALREAGLMDSTNTIPPRQATIEEISLCHNKIYLENLKKQVQNLPKGKFAPFDHSVCREDNVAGDFIISPHTWDVALFAAGAPLSAIDYILNEEKQNIRAFCVIRPPGHHAHKNTGSGFCVFNNVAIAAKHLTKNLGFQRVLIVDWDAHHGDGTQALTEADPKIFYFSTHKETSHFYPGPHWGKADQQGIGEGKGTVLNCPVNGTAEECREAILKAFKTQLIPTMEKFQPDFILISCGFDAHVDDTLVGLGVKDQDFAEMTKLCNIIAKKYANGRIISVLEGGYNLNANGSASVAHVYALSQ